LFHLWCLPCSSRRNGSQATAVVPPATRDALKHYHRRGAKTPCGLYFARCRADVKLAALSAAIACRATLGSSYRRFLCGSSRGRLRIFFGLCYRRRGLVLGHQLCGGQSCGATGSGSAGSGCVHRCSDDQGMATFSCSTLGVGRKIPTDASSVTIIYQTSTFLVIGLSTVTAA